MGDKVEATFHGADAKTRESKYAEVIWHTSRGDEGTISATGANIVARAVLALVDAELAAAWDAGHLTRWRRGLDDCECYAYSASECACGLYGTGELLSISANPYRS